MRHQTHATTLSTWLAGLTLGIGGCYEGFESEAHEDDDPFVDVELEPGPTSNVTCNPTMHVFPVAAAHNIGYDAQSCGSGTCEISCPDANANSDWSAAADHHGIDVFAFRDAPLVAVTDGIVVGVGTPSGTSGLRVKIRDACGWEYYYGHMSGAAVQKDQHVAAGQLIGTMGSTGTGSVHLHFNVSQDGDYYDDIDPIDLLRWTSATACDGEPLPPPPPTDDGDDPPQPPPPPPVEDGCGIMLPGEAIYVDEVLSSCSERYALVLQSDGNLVVYDVATATAIWDAQTVGAASSALAMQDDGNLVIYDQAGVPVWHTATHGHAGAWLNMQDDGNLVIYEGTSPLWSIR